MDSNSLAEELPTLYRAILDRVAELEAADRRPEARRLRTEATRIYSRAWDERARHRLETLMARSTGPEDGDAIHRRGFGRASDDRARPTTAVVS